MRDERLVFHRGYDDVVLGMNEDHVAKLWRCTLEAIPRTPGGGHIIATGGDGRGPVLGASVDAHIDRVERQHQWYCSLVLLSKASEILGRTVERYEELADRISIVVPTDGSVRSYVWEDGRTLLTHAAALRHYTRDGRHMATFDYEVGVPLHTSEDRP